MIDFVSARDRIAGFVVSVALLALAACAIIEPPPPRDNPRDVVVDEALAQLDRPYRYRGTDPSGFDAGGLVSYVFKHAGLELPAETPGQKAQGTSIPFEQLQRGDLIFYALGEQPHPEPHVGIFIGRSRMLHILDQSTVQIELINTAYWRRRFIDAVSYLP